MKRRRRIAALLAVLFLGAVAWLVVMLCWRAEGELRLARELSTGRLVARVPEPKQPFSKLIVFGPASFTVRFVRLAKKFPRGRPIVAVRDGTSGGGEQIWEIGLDPLDKGWDIEVAESRPVWLWAGEGKVWRIGTKTRVWRTKRVSLGEGEGVSSGKE